MKFKLLTLLAFLSPLFTFSQDTAEMGIDDRINAWFLPITEVWEGIVFWQVPGTGIPLIVIILVFGATTIPGGAATRPFPCSFHGFCACCHL